MPYGKLVGTQGAALSEFITGRIVHDLCCGDGTLTKWMAANGARHVHAVDINSGVLPVRFKAPNITRHHCALAHYLRNMAVTPKDMAFCSWPSNSNTEALLPTIKKFNRVAYLGKNTDGTACGQHDLWRHLTKRTLFHEVADKTNCLLLYTTNEVFPEPMFRSEEEIAGLLSVGLFNPLSYGQLLK